MSLNPVQFGKQVIDQFGRYLRTTFPLADPRLERQVAEALRHKVLDRFEAITLLGQLVNDPQPAHQIAAVSLKAPVEAEGTESTAEEKFLVLLEKRRFPLPPEKQYRVELGVEYTVADFAYPDEKVLIFIDGMSAALHGDPAQRRKDKLKRAKAKMQGFQVIEISAEGLKDKSNVALILDEIALLLGREDLLE